MNKINTHLCLILLLAATLLPALHAAGPAPASTLATVKSTNTLVCGVIREEEDYSKASVHGNRAAFDADICKALAAAILGDKGKILFSTFADETTALQALQAGKVQVVATATPSFANHTALRASFSPVLLADGQGFLVNKASHITSPADLAGKKVCFIAETSNVEHLDVFAARQGVKLFPFPFEEQGEMEAAMYTANCAAITSDITQLANTRARFNVRAKEFDILPQTISLDPLAIAYRSSDPEWAAVINAAAAALLQAEESSITSTNVDSSRSSTLDPAIPAYFGKNSGMSTLLHLDPDWAVRMVRSTGNYGEIYQRTLGPKSPLDLPRGLSRLWQDGGLLYPPPIGAN